MPQSQLRRLWKEKQRKDAPRMQGTESKALEQLQRNSKAFRYPECGFVDPIESTLLYAMLSAPDTFPSEAVQQMIEEEDFTIYMHTKDETVSYAQLSAILAYSAECNPSTTTKGNNQNISMTNVNESADKKLSVSQFLCKRVLKTVIDYAEDNDLDRETELNELLEPVKTVAQQRAEKSDVKHMLPFYLGYSASLLTANPIPLLVGTMGMAAMAGDNREELENIDTIISETDRVTDVERTGLLDYS